jgi:hypothetical protein
VPTNQSNPLTWAHKFEPQNTVNTIKQIFFILMFKTSKVWLPNKQDLGSLKIIKPWQKVKLLNIFGSKILQIWESCG